MLVCRVGDPGPFTAHRDVCGRWMQFVWQDQPNKIQWLVMQCAQGNHVWMDHGCAYFISLSAAYSVD
jgi:hypothetical protein